MSAIIPSESGHWYGQDGSPQYTITGKNGKERNTTLRDARLIGLVPSVTTILQTLAKPGLENWKLNQVLLAALTLPREEGETEDAFAARVIRDWQEEGKAARDRGIAIHASLECYYAGRPYGAEHISHINNARRVINEWHSGFGIAEKSFAHPLGFGGKCDLHCASALLDFKTTDKDLDALKTWDEQAIQLAAYREGLGIPEAKAAIVYVHTGGDARLIEISEDELQRGWLIFRGLLDVWKAVKNYTPPSAIGC